MLGRFRQKFASFMYGRYGPDTLYWWSFGAFIAIWLIRVVLGIFRLAALDAVSKALGVLGTAILVIAIFRFFSKNIYKRSAENRKFCAFIAKYKDKFSLARNRIRERDTHVYKKCPHCKAVLRLPRDKGEHTVRCPKCSERFSVRVR